MYTKEEIASVFNKSELKTGLEKYLEIMGLLDNTDVSKDIDFQKKYNHFYRMRQRKPEFYRTYYSYMEKMKRKANSLSFKEVFLYIHNETGRYEASFSSKLLATLNPDKPVWDTFVLENLGIKKVSYSSKDRDSQIISAYDKICKWYDDFMGNENAELIVSLFDEMFPDTKITATKKVDLFLWQHRVMKNEIIFGNTDKCEFYPTGKPNAILKGGKCDEYVRE